MNPFAHSARLVKVEGLLRGAAAFSAYRGVPLTARELLAFNEREWSLLAMISNVTNPSVKTRSMVIDRLCKRDAETAAANAATCAGNTRVS